MQSTHLCVCCSLSVFCTSFFFALLHRKIAVPDFAHFLLAQFIQILWDTVYIYYTYSVIIDLLLHVALCHYHLLLCYITLHVRFYRSFITVVLDFCILDYYTYWHYPSILPTLVLLPLAAHFFTLFGTAQHQPISWFHYLMGLVQPILGACSSSTSSYSCFTW